MNKTQNTSDINLAIRNTRFQKDRYWRDTQSKKSRLLSELETLSNKSEDEIKKTDLFALISLNIDYMRALNLYNYFRDELTKLLVKQKEQVKVIDENSSNENRSIEDRTDTGDDLPF